jgi:hypothetical protein
VLPGVIAHRLRLTDETMRSDLEAAASALIEAVPLP